MHKNSKHMDMLERVIIMMPSIFGESLFDDWFEDLNSEFFGKKNPLYGKHSKNLMKTDVRETEGTYEVDIDLPGFKKEDINVQLENGYLTITASKGLNKDEKNKEGAYIRQERYSGSMSRSFYVGDIPQSDIHAKYESGVLRLTVPKRDVKEIENSNYISIE